MPLTEKQTLLAAFDDAGSHPWESFESPVKDLTEEEALAQPAAYVDLAQEEGWPKPGSPLWHLVHLEYWYHYYLATLEDTSRSADIKPFVDPAKTLVEVLDRLSGTRAQLRAKIESLPDDAFDIDLRGTRLGEFVRMIIRHDTWHPSQIRMARRVAAFGNAMGE